MSKNNLQEPQRNRKFCQFNKDQYCTCDFGHQHLIDKSVTAMFGIVASF